MTQYKAHNPSLEEERSRRRAQARRIERLEELYHRYEGAPLVPSLTRNRWRHHLRAAVERGHRRGSVGLRRGIDVAVSGTALVVLAPLLGAAAVAIKATDGGPVLYWQTRVGRYGKTFRFPKFRSMVIDADRLRKQLASSNQHDGGITFKMRRDPRVTWIGRIIRRASIDELPQLATVLIGEMTLVGPRPPLPREVERYTVRDRRRLEVRPGITCTWQVSGRADIPFERQVEMDVDYIERRSLRQDLRLLVRTIPAVMRGEGAY